jgi:hypothetical protein
MLTEIEKAALSKGIKFDRDELQPTHDRAVPVALKIVSSDGSEYEFIATVKVGDDYDRLGTVSVPVKALLAAFAVKAGCVGPAVVEMLTEIVGMAISTGNDTSEALRDMSAKIDEIYPRIMESLSRNLPMVTTKGPVTVKATVNELVVV